MDRSVHEAVARRTRSAEAMYYRKLHEKMKRKEKSNGDGGDSVSEGSTDASRKRKVLDVVEIRSKKKSELGVDSDFNDDGQEMDVASTEENYSIPIEAVSSDEGQEMDLELRGDTGVVTSTKENYAIPIEVVSSDDEMVVNSSSITGSGSKVGGKIDEKFCLVDVEDVVSPRHEMGTFSGGKTSGVAERDQLQQLGDSEENVDVKDLNFVDLESSCNEDSDELEESDSEDDDDNNDRLGDKKWDRSMPCESDEREVVHGSNVKEGKEKEAVIGIKRRKAYGLDVFVDSSKDRNEDEGNSINITPGPDCVGRRTRSRSGSKLNENITKLGTVSHTFCVEEEEDKKEQESSCGDYDDGSDGNGHDNQANHNKKKINSRMGNVDHFLPEVGKYEDEIGKRTKRKRVCATKKLNFTKILLDSILNKGNGIVDELVSSREGDLDQETSPPHITTWKFFYPVKDSNPKEESEDGEENKPLWTEFDFALRSSEIDSTDSFMMDHENSTTHDGKSDPASLCSQGNHQFIIHEEVGLICKFCSCVELEMKYISPSFDKQALNRVQYKDYGETDCYTFSKKDCYTFNKLQFLDSGCDSQLGSDPRVHSKGTVWDMIPGIKNSLYLHQREGFEFIWKIIAGGINLHELEMKRSSNFNGGSGCVISHAPGTGKTRLILAFLQAYMELYPACKPVIIAPRSMLLTWEEQCKIWNFPMPFHNLNNNELSGKENMAVSNLLKEAKGKEQSVDINRMMKIYSWVQGKSILGLSYRLFESLVKEGEVTCKKKRKIQPRVASEIRKILLELPGLLVLDEGHTPRNAQSLIWKALSKIQTEKRIILSGTPFQNNFDELYNTLCLVRPKFSDTILIQSRRCNDFQKKRGRKVSAARGKWASLTNSIGNEADNRLEELRSMIDPFVHVHKGNILQESLPGLRESVVVLQPTHIQKSLLEGIQGSKNPIELGHMVSLISAHPSLLLAIPSEKEKFIVVKNKLERLRLKPDAGIKTKFLLELIRLSEAMNEKVLVFSQYIPPLILIMDQLNSQFNWIEGKEVLYMDGQRDVKQRQSSINVFNEETSEARVLLASTRACSEGINLIGASRVVLLDVVWNPSVERQAISRAYRLGQKRVVYIYHLITSGTMEGEKYCRQTEKDRLSGLVFSSTQNDYNGHKISDTVTDDKILEEMVQHDKLKDIFEKIIFQPKESNLIETFGLVSLSPANMYF